jgi:hypothetical protein
VATRILALIALVFAISGCGGGDSEPAGETTYTSTAHAGELTNVDANGAVTNATAASATLTSIAYTNTTASAETVRIQTSGEASITGQADGRAVQAVTVEGNTSTNETVVGTSDTSISRVDEVSVPAGETISVEVRIGMSAMSGPVVIEWGAVTTTLTPLSP